MRPSSSFNLVFLPNHRWIIERKRELPPAGTESIVDQALEGMNFLAQFIVVARCRVPWSVTTRVDPQWRQPAVAKRPDNPESLVHRIFQGTSHTDDTARSTSSWSAVQEDTGSRPRNYYLPRQPPLLASTGRAGINCRKPSRNPPRASLFLRTGQPRRERSGPDTEECGAVRAFLLRASPSPQPFLVAVSCPVVCHPLAFHVLLSPPTPRNCPAPKCHHRSSCAAYKTGGGGKRILLLPLLPASCCHYTTNISRLLRLAKQPPRLPCRPRKATTDDLADNMAAAAAEQQQQQLANKAVGGSRFAVTCGLLRQYMKEQGGNALAPAAMAMGLAPGADAAAAEGKTTVLELFPQQAGTLKHDHQRAPLTIFYDGKMVVFNDFPAEKAQELMHLAGGSGNAPTAGHNNALEQPSLTVTGKNACAPQHMPIARKASLKRFLEKRKNRLTAGDPYPAAASELMSKPVKEEDGGAPWLGVNSALSLN
ncbi:hypothetical protein HU200_003663 [Digitaria exilis]|uniref:Protein TIFY n=1 Tax=Digitaria exilis TaxID=1010633 RepID=A0A835KSX7_9POAL|nr:hypothetical protein HU200_003663 [Digitaria exilis]